MKDIKARIRHGNDTDIRLNGTEGKVCRFCTGFGNGVKQGALSDVRKTDNAYF